jgi:ubiquinone/menaquinone biosynthesis C-methylase UbiE
MNTQKTIQRQYDEVIAGNYDLDPQSVIGPSLDRATEQLRKALLNPGEKPLCVLDMGVGTGRFLARLKQLGGERVRPFGIDLSENMVALARQKVPDLVAAVDDAVNFEAHFPGQTFDLICTHFVTGYIPMRVLAPKIWCRLTEGGCWSIVAGTKAGFPVLQARARGKLLRWYLRAPKLAIDDVICNPAGRDEVEQTLQTARFVVRDAETFQPQLRFGNLEEFLEFGYRGGWLTPFIEAVGLHRASWLTRLLMNWIFFPVEDHHSIEIVLAQKTSGSAS